MVNTSPNDFQANALTDPSREQVRQRIVTALSLSIAAVAIEQRQLTIAMTFRVWAKLTLSVAVVVTLGVIGLLAIGHTGMASAVAGVWAMSLAVACVFATRYACDQNEETISAAQRVDKALGDDHHRITTALTLGECADPFAHLAMADGLARVEAAAQRHMVARTNVLYPRKVFLWLVVAMLLPALAAYMPFNRFNTSVRPLIAATNLSAILQTLNSELGQQPTPSPPHQDGAKSKYFAFSFPIAESRVSHETDAMSTNTSSPADPSGAAGSSSIHMHNNSAARSKAAASTRTPVAPTLQDAAGSKNTAIATTPSSAAESASALPQSSAAAIANSAPTPTRTSETASEADPAQIPDAPNAGKPAGTADGPGRKLTAASDKKGKSLGGFDSNEKGGQGQASTQSPPKKSRGVPPLMLGTRLPDTLTGRPLIGPSERMAAPGDPSSNPETPAGAGSIADRAVSEPVVDTYRVPAALQDVAFDYFQRLHAETPAVGENK